MRRSPKTVLFVLAHQDDECALSTRIGRECAAGHRVICAFLTDGGAKGVATERRNAESRRVLRSLGVSGTDTLFLGSEHGIPDGHLVLHLGAALERLEHAMRGRRVHRIYTLAYEGGHQDHDAAHAVALAFGRQRNLLHRTWQAPFYNGYGTPWRLFRVLKPLPLRARRLERGLGWVEAMRHSVIWHAFRSQWRTWLGLAPEYVVRRGMLRRETLMSVSPAVLRQAPHAGRLFYERFFGFSSQTFRDAIDPFLTTHLPPA